MSIWDNIEAGKYKNALTLTGTSAKPKELRDLEKVEAGRLTDAQFAEMKRLRTAFEDQLHEFRKSHELYRIEEARLNTLFEDDCAEAEGLTNHPKRSAVWGKAWEHGHASGYSDVWHWYQEFAEIAK